MGKYGRERVDNHLSWEHSVDHLLAAYERAFEKKGQKRRNASGTIEASTPISASQNQGPAPIGSDQMEG